MNKESIRMQANNSFQFLGVDVMLDKQRNIWLIESNTGPSLSGDRERKYKLQYKVVESMMNIQFQLAANKEVDDYISKTDWKVLYDEKKKGLQKYGNHFSEDCLDI